MSAQAVNTAVARREALRRRPYDLSLSHLTKRGKSISFDGGGGHRAVTTYYAQLMYGQVPAPTPAPVSIVTLVRSPARRTRSYFDYYVKSPGKFKGTFEEWLAGEQAAKLRNGQCAELGIRSEEELTAFARSESIALIMVAERMAESLVLLRRRMARAGWEWDMLDLVHGDQPMAFTWTGAPVIKSQLTATAERTAMQDNPLDVQLYEFAQRRLDVQLEEERAADGDGGRRLALELHTLRELQLALGRRCNGTVPTEWISGKMARSEPEKWARVAERLGRDVCAWLSLADEAYSNFVWAHDGEVGRVHSPTIEAELQALGRRVSGNPDVWE